MSEAVFTESEMDEQDKLLSNPIFFPDGFKSWVTDWFATNVPLIPYTQFFGARMNLARSGGFIATSESTSSGSYTDLTTAGPSLTGLADGVYLVAFGCYTEGQGSAVSRSINGAAASDDFSAQQNENSVSLSRMDIVTLSNDNNNSIVLKYRNLGGAGPSFSRRWLVVIRISTG